jgi:hypothetical protein
MSIDIERLADEVLRGVKALVAKDVASLQAQIAAVVADRDALLARVAELEARAPVLGPVGPAGNDGRDGLDGKEGPAGKDGAPGRDGVDGKDGRDGADGVAGRDGLDGKDGDRGPEGRLPIIKAWSDRVYYAGECVTLFGATWQARCDTGREPPHEDWTCLAARGEDGRSLRVRGTYDAEDSYEALDVVALNGGSFVALCGAPGDCPGPGWQLLTSPGKRGQKGEDGTRGPVGPSGADLVGAEIDDDGMVTFSKSDGTQAKLDLYPVLRRVM